MRRLIWSLVGIALLSSYAFAAPVAASGQGPGGRVAFTCTSAAPEFLGIAKDWAAGHTEHMRGWTARYTATGDLLCAGTVEVVANIEAGPGRGGVQGTVVYRLAGIDGGWTGIFAQQWAFPDALTDGWEVATGFGALEGWHLRAVLIEQFDGTIVETDYAFAPGV